MSRRELRAAAADGIANQILHNNLVAEQRYYLINYVATFVRDCFAFVKYSTCLSRTCVSVNIYDIKTVYLAKLLTLLTDKQTTH